MLSLFCSYTPYGCLVLSSFEITSTLLLVENVRAWSSYTAIHIHRAAVAFPVLFFEAAFAVADMARLRSLHAALSLAYVRLWRGETGNEEHL